MRLKTDIKNADQLLMQFEAHASDHGLPVQVFSDGPMNATVAVVGEGPGEAEVRTGKPWRGAAGNLLWENLRRFGLHRANVYTTNVVKRQISLGRADDAKNVVHRDELEKWIGLLRWELSKLPNLQTVFVMGNYALEAILGETGITQWRGSVVETTLESPVQGKPRIVKAVMTINPAYAMRELKMEPIFGLDCAKLGSVLNGTWKKYEIETLINPSYSEAIKYLDDLGRAKRPFALDVEFINQETACIGFANDPHYAMCLNWRDGKHNRYSLREEYNLLERIQSLCDSHRDRGLPIIGQNSQFDCYWLRLKDWLHINFSDDTLLQHHTLYPQLPHSLAFLCAQYTTHPFYKDEGKNWKEGGDIEQFWRYNGKDCAITLACWNAMEKELRAQGLHDFYHNHVMRAHPHLVSATIHGVAVDAERKEEIVRIVSEDVQALLGKFHDVVGELTEDPDYKPNPGSWQQMKKLYFDILKLKGRGTSTDEQNRIHMLKDAGTPPLAKEMLVLVSKYQEEAKFLGTYAESRVGQDGRFRCEYKQSGVQKAPGRLSSGGLLDGQGGNMQNQPERAKEMYVCDPGMVFGYFDLSQAEARVVGWRAGIEKWMEQFEQARKDGVYDCHRALASEMFKVPYDAVPLKDWDTDNNPTIRYTAKRCRHGLNYRMERFRLSEVTGLPYHEANRAFVLYHGITPELREWWEAEEKQFRKNREVFNALGRRHKVIQRLDADALNSIVAFYPQSTIGDKITQVWYQAEEDDKWPMDARVAIDVHDNLVAIASPKTIKTAMAILCRYAETAINVRNVFTGAVEPLVIPAEAKVSYPVRLTEKGYVKDPKGVHRWSHLEKLEL